MCCEVHTIGQHTIGQHCTTIQFTLPTYTDRLKIIPLQLQNRGKNPELFDIQTLAQQTEGYTFEKIGEYIYRASDEAAQNNIPLTTECILNTIMEVKL